MYMERPDERKEQLIKLMDERHATWAEETWAYICEYGSEKWTMGYTLSYKDKLEQIDILVEYFENLEKYEICSELMNIKGDIEKNNYLL
jgi:hypothetical protein